MAREKSIQIPEEGPIPFGLRVRAYRRSIGLTASELARRANLDPTTVAHFERGRPNLSHESVEEVLFTLGITEVDLIQASNEQIKQWYGNKRPIHKKKQSSTSHKQFEGVLEDLRERIIRIEEIQQELLQISRRDAIQDYKP